jgi:hypothetical protein
MQLCFKGKKRGQFYAAFRRESSTRKHAPHAKILQLAALRLLLLHAGALHAAQLIARFDS